MKTIYLVRGLPGSGKSTLASMMTPYNVAADDYFMVNGEYVFDPSKIGSVHERCQSQVSVWMVSEKPVIAVHNTFVQAWEIHPYLDLASDYGYDLRVVDLYDAGLSDEELLERNLHGVNLDTIQRMRLNYCLLKDLLND